MAKCSSCNAVKGKRECKKFGGVVCSRCCGEQRVIESCEGCAYWKPTVRRYSNLPRYSTTQMQDDFDLQDHSNAIESAICAYDIQSGKRMTDAQFVELLERLLDFYHFNEEPKQFSSELVETGFLGIRETMTGDLEDCSNEEIVKLLGVIRFVAQRRARGGRDHMTILHQYVGPRVGKGIRMLPHPAADEP